MSGAATADPVADDPAAVGFALLMSGVEAAVASAAEEIAALGQMVRQGFVGLPAVTPPALPMPATRPAVVSPLQPPNALERVRTETAGMEAKVWSRSAPELPTPGDSSLAPSALGSAPLALATPGSEVADLAPLAVDAAAIAPAETDAVQVPSLAPGASRHSALPAQLAPTTAPAPDESTAPPPLAAREAMAATLTPSSQITSGASPWSLIAIRPLPATRPVVAPVATASPAASLTPQAGLAPSSGVEGSVAPTGREMAPSPSSAAVSSGPTHGDVFLDGVRVGHWISETLARAAGGPARGGTAFDPRMGPRWPGALQGQ